MKQFKIYLNSEGSLTINEKVYSSAVQLVFHKYSEESFNITVDGKSILPQENTANISQVIDGAGNAYSDASALYSGISQAVSGTPSTPTIPANKTARLIDETGDITYIGNSVIGEPESGDWDIQKIDASSNPTSITYASGTWTDRATLTYL